MYSSLGKNSLYLQNITLAVKFFRNLLQLCCDIDDSDKQKETLEQFLSVVQEWNTLRKSEEGNNNPFQLIDTGLVANIGFLNLPIILEDSIEVFLNKDRVWSSHTDRLINESFEILTN